MIRPETAQDTAFRSTVRTWVEQNLPQHLRNLTFRPAPSDAMQWYTALYKQGWIAPHWSKAFGGMGASPSEQVILFEELARIGAPDIPTQGLNHIGPLLMKLGNEAQKSFHLPRILSGESVWCQGYSEPGSGSDLASVQTRGEIRGDRIVINGQKIWTTWGHHANWMYALVRSISGEKKKNGITFVLLDMNSKGITRRPIRTIAGDEEFCEVFFEDVSVPIENVVGEVHQGWRVATSLLDEERIRIGTSLLPLRALARLRAVLKQNGLEQDVVWRRRLARAEIAVETVTAAYFQCLERFEAGNAGGGESSYLKILATEITQEIVDLVQEAGGVFRAMKMDAPGSDNRVDFNEMFLQSRRLSIYGGSNEIQRTILASQVLGLGGR